MRGELARLLEDSPERGQQIQRETLVLEGFCRMWY